jgi:drug/metabolite transporter (DMT)-like permease
MRNIELTDFLKGNILILCNAMSYSLYLVIAKPILKQYNPFTVITYIFIFAAIEIFPLTISDVRTITYLQIPLRDYGPLIIIIIFATLIPYMLSTMALKRSYSSLVAVYAYLHPLLGAAIAAVVLGEKITVIFILAGILILMGVSLVSSQKLKLLKTNHRKNE